MISTGLVCDAEVAKSILHYFEVGVPSYYLPEHKATFSGYELESNDVYVTYHAGTVSTHIEEVSTALKRITSIYGVPCSVTVEDGKPDVQSNWTSYHSGVEVNGANGKRLYYQRVSDIPKAKVTFNQPQKITLSLTPGFEYANALKFLNSFHKSLIHQHPFNHQALGNHQGEFLPEQESLFFEAKNIKDGLFDQIEIMCPTGISDEIVNSLHQGMDVTFFSDQQPFHLELMKDEFFIYDRHNHYETITPAFLPGATKSGSKNLLKSPAGMFLMSLIYGSKLDTNEKPAVVMNSDGFLEGHLPLYGRVQIKATPIESMLIPRRGNRRGFDETPYKVELKIENHSVLRTIGMHSRFGCGILSPVLVA